ncbi:hypothetical protein E4U22_003714 [Claviceps purpurea]|nr:hypothetical protein E4U22_003714 [Claviceps purpurea]
MRWLPLSAFPRGSDGARARQCVRCNATQANRRPRQDPEQTAPLDEQDADGQDDGPPPASPRQETPAVDSVPTQLCSGSGSEIYVPQGRGRKRLCRIYRRTLPHNLSDARGRVRHRRTLTARLQSEGERRPWKKPSQRR